MFGRKGQLQGTKQKILNSYDMKKYCLKAIEIANPYSAEEWQDILTSLVEKNKAFIESGNIGVYFHVSRGTDTKRFHAYPKNIAPTVFGFAFEIAPPQPTAKSEARPQARLFRQRNTGPRSGRSSRGPG